MFGKNHLFGGGIVQAFATLVVALCTYYVSITLSNAQKNFALTQVKIQQDFQDGQNRLAHELARIQEKIRLCSSFTTQITSLHFHRNALATNALFFEVASRARVGTDLLPFEKESMAEGEKLAIKSAELDGIIVAGRFLFGPDVQDALNQFRKCKDSGEVSTNVSVQEIMSLVERAKAGKINWDQLNEYSKQIVRRKDIDPFKRLGLTVVERMSREIADDLQTVSHR